MTLESEENVPCLQGQQILWIDVGTNFDYIEQAVETMKNKTKFHKEENILLHDALSIDILKKVKAVWPDAGTRKNLKEFIGCECDSVIHISTGAGFSFYECYTREFSAILIVCFATLVVLLGLSGGGVVDGIPVVVLLIAVFVVFIVIGSGIAVVGGLVAGVFIVGAFVVLTILGAIVLGVVGAVGDGLISGIGVVVLVGAIVVGVVVGVLSGVIRSVVGGVFTVAAAIVIAVALSVGGSVIGSVSKIAGVGVGIVAGVSVGFVVIFIVFLPLFLSFNGLNSDSGYFEAITRARHFTGIITINKRRGYKKLTERLR